MSCNPTHPPHVCAVGSDSRSLMIGRKLRFKLPDVLLQFVQDVHRQGYASMNLAHDALLPDCFSDFTETSIIVEVVGYRCWDWGPFAVKSQKNPLPRCQASQNSICVQRLKCWCFGQVKRHRRICLVVGHGIQNAEASET